MDGIVLSAGSPWIVKMSRRWARHGGTPEEVLEMARCADLWALVDLAARRGQNPVSDRAHDRLLAIARTGDVHAE